MIKAKRKSNGEKRGIEVSFFGTKEELFADFGMILQTFLKHNEFTAIEIEGMIFSAFKLQSKEYILKDLAKHAEEYERRCKE